MAPLSARLPALRGMSAPTARARTAGRAVRARLTRCCAAEAAAPPLAAAEQALSINAASLATAAAAPPPPDAAQFAAGAAALLSLAAEERRLAAMEAELAAVEAGLANSASEAQLVLAAPAAAAVAAASGASAELQARLESTEAEAAALRALITAGRLDGASLLQPLLAEAPTVRQVYDWQDVEWRKLSARGKAEAAWDIVVGKTVDEWREEWALARAEGFGLRGLSTLLLAGTVLLCCAYALLSAATAGPGGALLSRPFALPTSTLLVMTRVLLSSVLILAEQLCTAIYYMPAGLVAAAAAAVLLYRRSCTAAGRPPFWAAPRAPPPPSQQVVLLKRIPVPFVPPVYYKGISVPDAIAELASQPGAGWPPQAPPAQPKQPLTFTLGEDVQRLLTQREAGAGGASGAAGPPPPGAGPDWRLEGLSGALGRAAADVRAGGAARAEPQPAARAAASFFSGVAGAAAPPQPTAAAASAPVGERAPMEALRGRFASMQGLLREGAEQARAAKDAAGPPPQ